MNGVKNVLRDIRAAHELLPLDRFGLQIVPVAARDESLTEHEKAQEWRETSAQELGEFYESWLPPGLSARLILDRLKIPYKPYWSFGERLPALLEGTSDPASVGFAYAVLTKLLFADLDWGARQFERPASGDRQGRRKDARPEGDALDVHRRGSESGRQPEKGSSAEVGARPSSTVRKGVTWGSLAAAIAIMGVLTIILTRASGVQPIVDTNPSANVAAVDRCSSHDHRRGFGGSGGNTSASGSARADGAIDIGKSSG